MKDFCVYGSPSLIKAFIEEIEILGFELGIDGQTSDLNPIPLKIHYYGNIKKYNKNLLSLHKSEVCFTLPQDWDKALKQCQQEKIVIDGYEAKVMDKTVHFGCVKLSENTLKEMAVLSSQTELKVAGETITSDTIYKLLNLLK